MASKIEEQVQNARVNIDLFAEQKNIGLASLASRAGIHEDTLRKFRRGHTDMGITNLLRVCEVLGCKISTLLRRN